MKIYEAAMGVLRKKERGDETHLPPKLVENLVWVPVISFCKISLSVTHLMRPYVETGRSQTVKFLVGHNCGGLASFFLYSEHPSFGFYIRHP